MLWGVIVVSAVGGVFVWPILFFSFFFPATFQGESVFPFSYECVAVSAPAPITFLVTIVSKKRLSNVSGKPMLDPAEASKRSALLAQLLFFLFFFRELVGWLPVGGGDGTLRGGHFRETRRGGPSSRARTR